LFWEAGRGWGVELSLSLSFVFVPLFYKDNALIVVNIHVNGKDTTKSKNTTGRRIFNTKNKKG